MSSPCRNHWAAWARGLVLVGLAAACRRETRQFDNWPPTASAAAVVREVDLQPGPPTRHVDLVGPYDGNAYGTGEGKRLYNQMNCSGCHFQGGGGIGPPLMAASVGRWWRCFEMACPGREATRCVLRR